MNVEANDIGFGILAFIWAIWMIAMGIDAVNKG